MNVSEDRLNKFYCDNRPGKPQRWVCTWESKEPHGYSQLIRWQVGRTVNLVYVWGQTMELTTCQQAVLSYWAVCEREYQKSH